MAWEKQVSGRQGPASGAYACEFLGSAGRRTQFELAILKEEGGQEEARPGSWIMDHGCAALVWPARARCFWVRKDEEPWSYRSSHPGSVPTYLPHWSTRKRTENAVRETHLE